MANADLPASAAAPWEDLADLFNLVNPRIAAAPGWALPGEARREYLGICSWRRRTEYLRVGEDGGFLGELTDQNAITIIRVQWSVADPAKAGKRRRTTGVLTKSIFEKGAAYESRFAAGLSSTRLKMRWTSTQTVQWSDRKEFCFVLPSRREPVSTSRYFFEFRCKQVCTLAR